MLAILSAPGSRGDVNPMIGIGRQLTRLGFDVVISLAEPYAEAAIAAGLEPEVVIKGIRFDELLADATFWTPVRGARGVLRTIATEFLEAHHAVIRRHHRPGETVMVAHPLDFASRVVHDADRGTPLVSVILAPAILRLPWEPPQLTPRGLERRLPAWAVSLGYRLADWLILDPVLAPSINRLRNRYGLPPIRRPLDRWWFSSETVLGMFPDWFAPELVHDYPRLVPVGFPLDDADDREFSVPIDRPIVVTAGTANRHARVLFQNAIDAGQRLARNVLLLSSYADNVPPNLPDHVRVESYLPLGNLLPHSALILHHGGIGTTAQALAAGIPQVIRPLAFDQFDNAARVERFGAGRWLRRDRDLVRVLDSVLSNPNVREAARQISTQMRDRDACRRAAELIQTAMQRADPC